MKLVAISYPACLILIALLFRWVGERWWATGVGLYLPRLGFAAPLPFVVAGLLVLRLWRLLYTQLLAALIVLFPLMGFVLPFPKFADDKPRIRVLSFNVDSLAGGMDNILAEIDKFSPDLVFLQEVFVDQDTMAERLRTRYPSVTASRPQFMFASRFPVVSTEVPEKVEFEGRMRTARFTKQIVDTPLGRIASYNVHPISPREGLAAVRGQGVSHEVLSGGLFASARSTAMQEGSALRELQIKAFADMASQESGPVVIAGDTNLPSQSFFLHHFLSSYSDGFSDAGWGFGYTFPSYRRAWMRIDRILANDALRFVRFDVGQSKASDHYCVVADLQAR